MTEKNPETTKRGFYEPAEVSVFLDIAGLWDGVMTLPEPTKTTILDAVKVAIDDVRNKALAKARRWVDVAERLPPGGTVVAAKDQHGCLWLAMHDGRWNCMEHGCFDDDTRIVKWAALPPELYVYKNNTDHVIAESAEQAMAIHKARGFPEPLSEFQRIDGDATIRIESESGGTVVEKTAREWVEQRGEAGFLCSLISCY